MTLIKDEGIIIGIQKLKDADLIIRWITESHGRLDTVARSAKSPSSRFAGTLGIYNKCLMSVHFNEERELHPLSEVNLSGYPKHLIKFLDHLNAIGAVSEIIEQLTEKQTPIPEIYFQVSEFTYLEVESNKMTLLKSYLDLEIKLFSLLGILPQKLPEELLAFLKAPVESKNLSDKVSRYLTYTQKYLSKNHASMPQKRVNFLKQTFLPN